MKGMNSLERSKYSHERSNLFNFVQIYSDLFKSMYFSKKQDLTQAKYVQMHRLIYINHNLK